MQKNNNKKKNLQQQITIIILIILIIITLSPYTDVRTDCGLCAKEPFQYGHLMKK
jgi:hypothetical protein